MKTIILLLTLISVVGYSQTFHIGAGATVNDNKFSPLGYYASAKVTNHLSGNVGFSGVLIFMNQISKSNDITSKVNSVSGEFLYNYFLLKDKMKLMAGFQMGLITSASNNNKDKGLFSFNAGASYELRRIEISAKYMTIISDNPFNSTLAIGAAYRIR